MSNQTSSKSLSAAAITNISCYKFVALDRLDERRMAIRRRAVELGLKGTVLLSREGINLFVAGTSDSVRGFVDFLRDDPALSDLEPKESPSVGQPFNRMLVKIKKEIISFGVDGIAPAVRTAPKLPATELKRWLDEGRPVRLLDTRNDYEYDLGTFDNAVRMGLDHFRQFPDAVSRLPESMKSEPVVMFCTGGIRCEKAGPFLQQAGFQNVYQLDGGILKYFELVGGAHWHGECFVFDQRVAVDPQLQETETTQCYICQAVVTADQQRQPSYVPGRSCPACYREPAQSHAELLALRQRQIVTVTTPLPGSTPCLNRRPLNVPARCAGMTLIDFVCDVHPHVAREDWLKRIADGTLVEAIPVRRKRGRSGSAQSAMAAGPLAPDHVVKNGEKFDVLTHEEIEPDVNADVAVLHEDDEFIVLAKPAPLPVHASGRFNRNTLRHIINLVWFPVRPHIVHRLDANTSGVMILCKRKRVASIIQQQFEQRRVFKSYLARVAGHPASDQLSCDAPIASTPGCGGLREVDPAGDAAVTEFEVLDRLDDGTSLLRAFPLTGRTNQIRIHLWHLGFPVVGDPAWLPNGAVGPNRTLLPAEPPMCLHAERLRVSDASGASREFCAPAPAWFRTTET